MRQPKDIIIGNYTLKEILKWHNRWQQSLVGDAKHADLHGADLHDVDLSYASLNYADLSYTNLYGANLHGANLHGANFMSADLHGADLSCAYLCNANLRNVRLWGANFRGAYLMGTDLHNADFLGANLYHADFYNVEGSFIEYRKGKILTQNIVGYKKCHGEHGDVIVTLEIPRGAIVFSINGYKFRTNKAKVIGIDGVNRAISDHQYTSYYVGDEFTIYNFDCQYNIECGTGIHFFMTREEAENYKWG